MNPRATPLPVPTLEQLMDKLDALRHQSLARRAEPAPALAVEGRRLPSGVHLAERRVPLWYLARCERPTPRPREATAPLPLRTTPPPCRLFCLVPAEMDDGERRLFLAGTARVEEGQLVLRQCWADTPGGEAALLSWLEGELAGGGAPVPAGGASRALLLDACRRHGRPLSAPRPPLARAGRPSPARLAWRTLDRVQAGRALSAQRRQLLSLAGRLSQDEALRDGSPSVE